MRKKQSGLISKWLFGKRKVNLRVTRSYSKKDNDNIDNYFTRSGKRVDPWGNSKWTPRY